MNKMSEAELTVIDALQRRRERIKRARSEWELMTASQRTDALFLVDQGRCPKTEICLYAGISRPTLDSWINSRDAREARQQ